MFLGPWCTNSLINEQHKEDSKGKGQGQLCKQVPWKIREMSDTGFCLPHVAVIGGLSAKPWCLNPTGLVARAYSRQAGADLCMTSLKKSQPRPLLCFALIVCVCVCVCMCVLFQTDIFIISIKSELFEGSTGDHT